MKKNDKVILLAFSTSLFFLIATLFFLSNLNILSFQDENISGFFILDNPFTCGNDVCIKAKSNPNSPFYCPKDCENNILSNNKLFFDGSCGPCEEDHPIYTSGCIYTCGSGESCGPNVPTCCMADWGEIICSASCDGGEWVCNPQPQCFLVDDCEDPDPDPSPPGNGNGNGNGNGGDPGDGDCECPSGVWGRYRFCEDGVCVESGLICDPPRSTCGGDVDCDCDDVDWGTYRYCHGEVCVVSDEMCYPPGDECVGDGDCEPPNDFYKVCNVNQQCVLIAGEGENSCGSSIDCDSIDPGVPTYWACSLSNQCVELIGNKDNQCDTSANCVPVGIDPINPPPKRTPGKFNSITSFESVYSIEDGLKVTLTCIIDDQGTLEIPSAGIIEPYIGCGEEGFTTILPIHFLEKGVLELTYEIEKPCGTCRMSSFVNIKDAFEGISINDNNSLSIILLIMLVVVIFKIEKLTSRDKNY